MNDDHFSRRLLIVAGLSGALAVILGAFAAHGLDVFLADGGMDDETVKKRLSQFDVGARYHLIHTVALLALAAIPYGSPKARRVVAALFVAGILLFSGSLYLLVISNTPKFGAITPLGGLSWIGAWMGMLALARKPRA